MIDGAPTLTDDELSLVLSRCTFVKASVEATVDAFRGELARYNIAVSREGTLQESADLREFLSPLSAPPTKFALVRHTAEWTLLLQNLEVRILKSDPNMARGISELLSCVTVTVVSVPGRNQFFLHESGAMLRTIECFRDSGSWVFHTQGDPQAFEDVAAYSRTNAASRFGAEALGKALVALGIPFPIEAASVGPGAGLERDETTIKVPAITGM